MRNAELGRKGASVMRSVECGLRNKKRAICNAECGMRNAELGRAVTSTPHCALRTPHFSLGLFSATMLVVGNTIGVGIFTTSGVVAEQLPSPGLMLMVWTLGGVLALAGALAWAELGAAFPLAGGAYIYLREAFGPFWGFLSGWAAFIAGSPGSF